MYCVNCGKKLEDISNFCNICGTPVYKDNKEVCASCGAEMLSNNNFCTECGVAKGEVVSLKTKQEVEKEFIDPDAKKIDTILKLGVGMVGIAGLVLATTNWSSITDSLKVLLLLIISALFFGLYRFSEEKIKIDKTTKTYWSLGIVFIAFTWLSTGVFKVFGDWFSIYGDGSSLFYASLTLLLTLLSYFTYKKFTGKVFVISSYIGVLLTIVLFLDFLSVEFLEILALITMICISVGYTNRKYDVLEVFIKILSFVTVLVAIFCVSTDFKFMSLFVLVLSICNLLYILLKNRESKAIAILVPASINILSFVTFMCLYETASYVSVMISINMFITYLLIILYLYLSKRIEDNLFLRTYKIMMTLICLLFFLSSLFDSGFVVFYTSMVLFATNLINRYLLELDSNRTFSNIIAPGCVLILIIGSIVYFNSLISNPLTFSMSLIVISLVLLSLYNIYVDKKKKKIYYIMAFPFLIISSFCSTIFQSFNANIYNNAFMESLLLLAIFISLYVVERIKSNLQVKRYISKFFGVIYLILALFTTISLVISNNALSLGYIYSSIVILALFTIIYILCKRQKDIIYVLPLVSIVPALSLIINLKLMDYQSTIILASYLFFVIYLLQNKISNKNKKYKNIISLLGSAITLFLIMFEDSVEVGIYIGVVSICLIAIGYSNDDYKGLFIVGIVSTIVNIIYQLRNIWVEIPAWLYLLVTGLILIGFVTYKQLKKENNKE